MSIGSRGSNCTSNIEHKNLVMEIWMATGASKWTSVSHKFKRTIDKKDIELAGLVLGWLVLEYVVADLKFKHIGRFCENTSAVALTYRVITSISIPSATIIQFLELRKWERKSSSLTSMGVAVKDNDMADIPSRKSRMENLQRQNKSYIWLQL